MKNKTSSEYISETMRETAIYLCDSRGIGYMADGLKDSQRKALWVIRNKADKIKTVSLGGEMISEDIYLHGDASASDTISRMAAPYCNNVTYLEGVGIFGTKLLPAEWGQPRYTYVKKSSITQALFFQDKDIIPMKGNYDDSKQEPKHFLPLIPLILLNGVSGMAMGWSTNILPRNFQNLVQATQNALNGKSLKNLLEPSFKNWNTKIDDLGDGRWLFTGHITIIDSSTVKITELPPGMKVESLRKKLIKFEEEEKIIGFTDNSTKEVDIIVKLKRGMAKDWTEADAIDFFKLRETDTDRLVIIEFIDDVKRIKQYETAEELVQDFVKWRFGWYKVRYEKKLADDNYELKFWLALQECFKAKLPNKLPLPTKKEIEELVEKITAKIGIDENQVDKIVGLPTYRWADDYLITVKAEIAKLQANIQEYIDILGDTNRMKKIYMDELEDLKKLKV